MLGVLLIMSLYYMAGGCFSPLFGECVFAREGFTRGQQERMPLSAETRLCLRMTGIEPESMF
jgi:hypothetical protein